MGEETQQKICAKCGHKKVVRTDFYRTKNGKDGHMKICKDCYMAEKRERDRIARLERERLQQQWEERNKRMREIEAKRATLAEKNRQAEKSLQEQRIFLEAWLDEQPPRTCIACQEIKAAREFGYSEFVIQSDGYWLPRLHQRCIPCHEAYREKQLKPCVLCHQGIKEHMSHLGNYVLFGAGIRISLCCWSCGPAFQALPPSQQQLHIQHRVNSLFSVSQQIYAEVDPLSQEIRYIGRSGRTKRRHGEHKRNIHKEQHYLGSYDQETGQYQETLWTSRANWMFDLKQRGLEAKQQILLDVQPAAYVLEYERRYILHAIQQGWPIVNTEAFTEKHAREATLDFLQAPFEDLVGAGWFAKNGVEAFLRAYIQ